MDKLSIYCLHAPPSLHISGSRDTHTQYSQSLRATSSHPHVPLRMKNRRRPCPSSFLRSTVLFRLLRTALCSRQTLATSLRAFDTALDARGAMLLAAVRPAQIMLDTNLFHSVDPCPLLDASCSRHTTCFD